MYTLHTKLISVSGVGSVIANKLSEKNIFTVKDLLLILPLHYVDRSNLVKISDLKKDQIFTFKAEVTSISNFYRRGRSIQSASVKDETGKVKLMWFNNRFILRKLIKGNRYLFSGKLNNRNVVTQPVVESLGTEMVHTGRIVPVYSQTFGIKIGTLRKILKHILDNLNILDIHQSPDISRNFLSIKDTLTALHFPDRQELVAKARERLALEEILNLIRKSQQIKKEWQKFSADFSLNIQSLSRSIPKELPFELTKAQKKATKDILDDLKKNNPMNRLLLGDVGSGKTVVVGIAISQVLSSGHNVALVVPTKMLAKQHFKTFSTLFFDLNIKLLINTTKKDNLLVKNYKPCLYIGTHKVINNLAKIHPALVIYDEQHRFGVGHRSASKLLQSHPHLLTMSATPIPRSLMLSIFSHLDLSLIDEMPPGRLSVKTWLVPEKKRLDAYFWAEQLTKKDSAQIFVVCPFIEKSKYEGLEGVVSAKEKFKQLRELFRGKLEVGLLHGRQKKKDQEEVINKLYNNQISILVTTPIVEVGIDLKDADVIMIENAERFGLASLHQLRGRVGRRTRQGNCLLFSKNQKEATKKRLEIFTKENNGMKLAEFDLKNRGAGDIFGFNQSGFDNLKFANWADLTLLTKARKISEVVFRDKKWVSFFQDNLVDNYQDIPLSN